MTARPTHGPAVPLLVGLGGALGSLGRWGVSRALPPRDGGPLGGLPWGTLLVNVSGAVLIGLVVAGLAALAARRDAEPVWVRPFLVVGVLGGWTTMSTLVVELGRLAGHRPAVALVYLLASVALGVGGCVAGLVVGERVLGGSPGQAEVARTIEEGDA